MSGRSKIEWTDETWNPTRGCAIRSPGCTNCYAMRQARRSSGPGGAYEGLTEITKAGPVWTGEMRVLPELLSWPLSKRAPASIFVDSMSDLFFGDEQDRRQCEARGVPFRPVPFTFIAAVFGVAAIASHHRYQILTKRSERALAFFKWMRDGHDDFDSVSNALSCAKGYGVPTSPHIARWPLPNVWMGVSVEDRERLDRISDLAFMPAAVRFVSFEPLLEDVDVPELDLGAIDWAIIGAESGPRARRFEIEWAERLIARCRLAGVAPFMKQVGPHPTHRGSTFTAPPGDRKGGDPAWWGEAIKVREYPKEAT